MNKEEKIVDAAKKEVKIKVWQLLLGVIIVCGAVVSVSLAFYNQNTNDSECEETQEDENCSEISDHDTNIPSSVSNYTNYNLSYDAEIKKPIIYIYPEETQEVSIRLGKPENLISSYPDYEGEWKVLAEPTGELTYLETGRKLYSLYWEGKNTLENAVNEEEGFVVKGEDTVEFLEEKLAILGLNEKETEEFIIYWLPQMQNNKYNYIRFESIEEINENMPLEIDPEPETLIRIVMEWKGLDEKIEVKEQKLEQVQRVGYTVVEWGGTKLQDNVK